jgi:hypothetical protein
MTEASLRALEGLRNPAMLKWYVIPLLAIVFYIYASEIKHARHSGNWDAVLAGITLFGVDFFNETWNGWVLNISGHSAFWTASGDTALRVMVGWNIEIMFMFAIAGIIYYHTISNSPAKKIFGIPNRWFWAVVYSAFCVAVEILLNAGGLLAWAYPFWTSSFSGVWLIFLFGYFHFYLVVIFVLNRVSIRSRIVTIASIYAIAVLMNVFGMGIMGWRY